MRKLLMLFLTLFAVLACPAAGLVAGAEEESKWTSAYYSITEDAGLITVKGAATYSRTMASRDKVYLNGYSAEAGFKTIDGMDWYAFIFGPAKNSYVTTGGAISLLLSPRGDNMELCIMHSTTQRLSALSIPRTSGDKYTVSAGIADGKITFYVNNAKIETDSGLFNYNTLSRGVYHSISANGAPANQEMQFEMSFNNFNYGAPVEGLGEIIYGATLDANDERIAALESEDFIFIPGEPGTKNKGWTAGIAAGAAAFTAGIVLIIILNKKVLEEK